jgi:hypothetical protein
MADSALEPELRRTVEQARVLARQRGELLDGPSGVAGVDLSPAARAALTDWVTSGDYERAVQAIVADDPDIATQRQESPTHGPDAIIARWMRRMRLRATPRVAFGRTQPSA